MIVYYKHTAIRMSCERGLLEGSKKIKVNYLQRALTPASGHESESTMVDLSWLVSPHVSTDIITGCVYALKIIQSLPRVDHLLNRGQGHISKTSVPANPFIFNSIVSSDLCICTCLYVKEVCHRNNMRRLFDWWFWLAIIVLSAGITIWIDLDTVC